MSDCIDHAIIRRYEAKLRARSEGREEKKTIAV